MDERIQLETEGIKPEEVVTLNLDFVRCSGSIEGLLGLLLRLFLLSGSSPPLPDKFVNLAVLSLNGVGLSSLKGFPKLTKLRKVSSRSF